MRPGVITLSDRTSLRHVQRTIASHGVHAVLVVENRSGKALGWATARGLLAHAKGDLDLTSAKEAITEPAVTISPSATVREALEALLSSDGTRLLVCPGGLDVAEGVVTDFDLVTILVGPVP